MGRSRNIAQVRPQPTDHVAFPGGDMADHILDAPVTIKPGLFALGRGNSRQERFPCGLFAAQLLGELCFVHGYNSLREGETTRQKS
jgi:hypothetical protein